MKSFKQGNIVYHKATVKRCVVISDNGNGTIKVRDQENHEVDYYPQELELNNGGGSSIIIGGLQLFDLNKVF